MDEWAWMAVADQGPGLPEEPEGGRIGLGLSIVEQIAQGHEGALVSSTGPDGAGTTMTIWLPKGDTTDSPPTSRHLQELDLPGPRFVCQEVFKDDKRGNDPTSRPHRQPSKARSTTRAPPLHGSVATEAPVTQEIPDTPQPAQVLHHPSRRPSRRRLARPGRRRG